MNKHVETVPLRVGITGGIGSGKTTVCRLFEALGVPVYYADERAKAIMVENDRVKSAITDLFGTEAYLPDGSLNRSFIASVVFADKSRLERLNSIVHPAVGEDYARWHLQQKPALYTLKEAALLFESGSYRTLDAVILVTAPEELRIQRVMARDNTTAEAVQARIAHQLSEEQTLPLADFVILNDGKHSLIQQVWSIHHALSNRSTLQVSSDSY